MGGGPSQTVAASTAPGGEFDYKMHLLRQTKSQVAFVDSDEKDCSQTVRHPDAAKGIDDKGLEIDGKYLTNVWAVFQAGCEKHKDLKAIGWRPLDAEGKLQPYTWITYTELKALVEGLCCAMSKAGVKKETNVGIFSRNRPEWTQTMFATQGLAARTVALYDTLGDEALEHILKQAEIKVLFTEKNKLKKLAALLKKMTGQHCVERVVVFDYQEIYGNTADKLTDDDKAMFKDLNVEIEGFSTFHCSAKDVKIADCVNEVAGGDLCNIMYTSGTTGLPKGVMLSNLGICAAVQSAKHRFLAKFKGKAVVKAGGRHYSYLPLAHIFELMVEVACVVMGIGIGFSNGNIKLLADDLGALRPTLFIGVPRIYGKFFEKFWAGVDENGGMKKWMAKKGFATSSTYIRDNKRSGFYDSVVWGKVAKKMGLDKTTLTITGAAPMPGYLMEFMKLVTNCPMIQGYGLTETSACGNISLFDDTTVGHVGIPTIGNEIRLKDIPEMNYVHTDETEVDKKMYKTPRGEIQIRGAMVFKGYYKMPEKTAEVLDKDGWFATGDVGRINPNGTVSIIDRKKNIFKLSQGEYIAVEKVENVYGKSASINQLWVYGNSNKSFIVAVVVPNALWVTPKLGDKWKCEAAPATPEYCKAFKEVMADKDTYEMVKKEIFEDMKKNVGKLKGFEKIRQIYLETDLDNLLQGFNVDNNCLTPSFKLKRPQLKKRYLERLIELYTAGGEAPKPDENW